ncbi:hypothetical protein E4T56_gene13499 [Termitomyces sp. T112]|nr:hypothetical protein E4T56_gene13499 [Termitomyces sp. T112]
MAYRTRLRSATLTKSAALAAPEDTPENRTPQEAPSELTELDGTTGSTTPRAASPWRAGATPAMKADAPESQTNWDAHLSAGEVPTSTAILIPT